MFGCGVTSAWAPVSSHDWDLVTELAHEDEVDQENMTRLTRWQVTAHPKKAEQDHHHNFDHINQVDSGTTQCKGKGDLIRALNLQSEASHGDYPRPPYRPTSSSSRALAPVSTYDPVSLRCNGQEEEEEATNEAEEESLYFYAVLCSQQFLESGFG